MNLPEFIRDWIIPFISVGIAVWRSLVAYQSRKDIKKMRLDQEQSDQKNITMARSLINRSHSLLADIQRECQDKPNLLSRYLSFNHEIYETLGGINPKVARSIIDGAEGTSLKKQWIVNFGLEKDYPDFFT